MLPGLMLEVSCLLLRVNVAGSPLVVVVGIFWLVACWLLLLCSCSVCAGRWLQPHFAFSAAFDCDRWSQFRDGFGGY